MPARPTTSAELAARVAGAGEGVQVRVAGSASLPVLAFDDGRAVAEISTLRMNKMLEQSAPDMTVTVQAGMSLEVLQRHLAWQNQWLPVDPPAGGGRLPGQRTIGGLIATNSLGPLRLGMGGGADWRLLVLGMKWVDAHGTLLASGSRTVKNVAGYAAHRLLIGSGGALGIIAEVTLRTFARPPDERCVLLFCESAAQAEKALAEVLTSSASPAYLQVIGGGTFAGNPLGMPAPVGRGGERGMVVAAGFLGRADTCAAQVELVRGLPGARDIESISQTAAQAGRLRLWMTSEPAGGESGVGFRLSVRSSAVAELVARVEAMGGGAWVVSEAGSGAVRGVLRGASEVEAFAGFCREGALRPVITQGRWPSRAGDDGGLSARLKRELDPHKRFGTWVFS